ncbi:hypothetical protein EQH57_0115 [Dictyocoela roeselum]|nr:hypothetical protein EQH57_0115 [Dictyocoela roeselum]
MTTRTNRDIYSRYNQQQRASIKGFSKSLFTKYLRGDYISVGYLILSSKSKNPKVILDEIKKEQVNLTNTFRVDDNFEIITFDITSPVSGLRFTHKINLLKSISNQEVCHCVDVFRETAKICNWTPEIQFDVLKQIVDVHIHILIGESFSPQKILTKIQKIKYNYQSSFIYHNKLAHTRQSNFYTIHAYYNEIKNACYRLGVCLDWDHKMIEGKIKETFLSNLDIETKLEMTKYPIIDLNSFLNQIFSYREHHH